MAETIGLAASVVAVVDMSLKVVSKCKHIIETAKEAPRELRNILVETSSLKSTLENLKFLSEVDQEFSEAIANQQGVCGAVEGCRVALDELSDELGSLTVLNAGMRGRRQKVAVAISWTWKAAAVHKLLEEIGRYKSTISVGLLSQTARDINEIKTTLNRVDEKLTAAERRDICNWLELNNPTTYHNEACRLHEEHTSQWMLRVHAWNAWLDPTSPARSVWIHGIPGAGKTCLASFLVEQCQEYCESPSAAGSACVYYYCSYRNTDSEPTSLLCWVVSQLCRKLEFVPSDIVQLHKQNSHPKQKDLTEALEVMLEGTRSLYLLVDAVDESDPRDDTLSLLQSFIVDPKFNKIRLLLTSRKYSDIEAVLRKCSSTLPMDNDEVGKDIRTYVAAEVERKFVNRPEDLRLEVVEAVATGAKGMFRWAYCQVDILKRKRRRQDVLRALEELPETLDATYERILLDIPRDDWPLARTILTWICASDQIAEKLPTPVLLAKLNHDAGGEGDPYSLEIIDDVCGCLVTVFQDNPLDGRGKGDGNDRASVQAVKLSHFTVREFLCLDRIGCTKVRYFAVTADTKAVLFLAPVFQAVSDLERLPSGKEDWYYSSLAHYCAAVVSTSMGNKELQEEILRRCELWETLRTCLLKVYRRADGVRRGNVWHMAEEAYSLRKMLFIAPTLSDSCQDSETARIADIMVSLLASGWPEAAARFVDGEALETVLRCPLEYNPYGRSPRFAGTTFAYLFVTEIIDQFEQFERLPEFILRCLPGTGARLLRQLFDDLRSHTGLDPSSAFRVLKAHRTTAEKVACCSLSDNRARCWLLDWIAWAAGGVNKTCDRTGLTLLQIATGAGDCGAATWLLEAGADPNHVPFEHLKLESPLRILRDRRAGHSWQGSEEQAYRELEDKLLSCGARDFITGEKGTSET